MATFRGGQKRVAMGHHDLELPAVEAELEGSSRQWLMYWMMEVTAGPPNADWALAVRLHHRSVAWGLMGEAGGVNAVGLGFRYRIL